MNKYQWRATLASAATFLLLLVGCGGSSSDQEKATLLASTGSFGVTSSGGILTVDSGAGLVFKVNENGGDINSIKLHGGTELQSQTKGSHIASGLGATVASSVSGGVAKITLTTPTLTHYFLVRQNENIIYMGTFTSAEPTIGELRWITRLNSAVLTNVPVESNLAGTTGNVESKDVFFLPNGQTRSKYYGNQRNIDLSIRGVTGNGVGVFMAYGNRESGSGGPFYRDIQNQNGGDTEVYNYMNSGHNQTEADRMGFHGPYALVFTTGGTPAIPDMSWMGSHGLTGWVAPTGRGKVVGNGLAGRDTAYSYVVGFANPAAQYWTTASSTNGSFDSANMKPGTYTMTIYKDELAVHTENVTVTAGGTTTLSTRTITNDPAAAAALWRIGKWDGTPNEFKNGGTFAVRHPSDVRNSSWGPVTFTIGEANNVFPAAQWQAVNNPSTIIFHLTSAQIANHKVRIGITAAYDGARPQIKINSWTSVDPGSSNQPKSRSLTTGSYRGNNTLYTYDVPASAFVAGTNHMEISVIGNGPFGTFLSPGYSYDAVDLL